MLDLHITDEDELYKIGLALTRSLAVDLHRDPDLVVQGYKVLKAHLGDIDTVVQTGPEDLRSLEQRAMMAKTEIVQPLRRIREEVEHIQRGEPYNPVGLAACFGLVIQAAIGFKSRAREYQSGA